MAPPGFKLRDTGLTVVYLTVHASLLTLISDSQFVRLKQITGSVRPEASGSRDTGLWSARYMLLVLHILRCTLQSAHCAAHKQKCNSRV